MTVRNVGEREVTVITVYDYGRSPISGTLPMGYFYIQPGEVVVFNRVEIPPDVEIVRREGKEIDVR